MKRKTKQTLKTILLGALGIGAIVGVASGVNALVDKNGTELKTIHPTFEIGGLRETDGKYEKSDKTLYTKNAFECQGLQIKLAFDNYVDYQVFFYEDDGDFISATNVISGNESIDVPFVATHARLELSPNWAEMGEDYAKEKDQIIKWYETIKYSSQIEVKVNKEQRTFVETIEQDEAVYTCLGQGEYNFDNGFRQNSARPFYYFSVEDADKYDELIIKVKTSSVGKMVAFNESVNLASILLYDLEAKESYELKNNGTDGFTIIHEEDGFSYVSYDISNIDEIVVACSNLDVDTLKVYMR